MSECKPNDGGRHIHPVFRDLFVLFSEHGRAVERLIEERRAQFRRQKELEMEELREQQRAEEERKAIIEQERRRLLREHATKLLGYLPKVRQGLLYSLYAVAVCG